MNADIQAQLDAIKAPFQGVIAAADAVPALVEKAVADAKQEGIETGKAMIQLPDASDPTAVYTQEQMNKAINDKEAEVTGKLQPQIDALNAQVTEKDAKLANLENRTTQFEVEKADAVRVAKKEMLAGFKNVEIDNEELIKKHEAELADPAPVTPVETPVQETPVQP